jgi:beta-glucanase (GH16 family)
MMRKLKFPLLLTAILALYGSSAMAQTWTLVWSDEFNTSIGPDWVFETGAGGWGNNELEYYRQENATIENGQLVINAKHESFGGANYTSARMKTQGKKSWTYGRIEARIASPSFSGSWPAFWMLGNNINSVGWPACGEIDIMEHVNTNADVNGTVHWVGTNGGQADYGSETPVDVTGYHVYAIEWDPTAIKWFVDNTQYCVINIANGVGSTEEFQKDFFILLNFAVGGNWPGFTIDNNAFPAKMYVDYVRVYSGSGGTGTGFSTQIQAENYSSMSGVQTEGTTDTGGGLDVGYIDTGDWMAFPAVTIPTTGQYKVEYRVASLGGGGQLSLDENAGTTILGYLNIPDTGGWQNWTTISQTVTINAGTYNFGIYAQAGNWNLNWFRITKL